MLFYPTGATKALRVQGAFISDKEVEKVVSQIKTEDDTETRHKILEKIEEKFNAGNDKDKKGSLEGEDDDDDTDSLLPEAIEFVIDSGKASTSKIQSRFKVGYARAGRIIDQMEQRGIISGYQGSKPREVLMSRERWEELNRAPANEPAESEPEEEPAEVETSEDGVEMNFTEELSDVDSDKE